MNTNTHRDKQRFISDNLYRGKRCENLIHIAGNLDCDTNINIYNTIESITVKVPVT